MNGHEIAILHDQFEQLGGAERVAIEMARMFDAPIYVATVSEDVVPDDITATEISDSRIGSWAMNRHHLVEDVWQMLAWQVADDLCDYDVLIQNKNNPMWYVPNPDQTIVKYCHSTPRSTYDLFHERADGLLKAAIELPQRVLMWPNRAYVDAWAVNSDVVQRRLDSYWDIPPEDCEVIYPPVDVERFSPRVARTQDYYLFYSRLAPNKCIDQLIEAFAGLDQRLVIGGDGGLRDELEQQAGPHENIQLVGYLDERDLVRRVAEAKALVFNAVHEDFGMVPVEAMASGTPVIGVDEGMTHHQILPGRNGLLYDRGVIEIREAVRHFEERGVDWSEEQIARFADQFGVERFRRELREFVSAASRGTPVRPDLDIPDDNPEPSTPTESIAADGGEF